MSENEKVIAALKNAIAVLEKVPRNPPSREEPSESIRMLAKTLSELVCTKYPRGSLWILPE